MKQPPRTIGVTPAQLELLESYKTEKFKLKAEIHADIFPTIVEDLKQIRELTQNIAVIAGAITAFTIPVVNTDFIQTKLFAYTSILLLLSTISYAVHHLGNVITTELNELGKQHSTFMKLMDDEIEKVYEIMESGDIGRMLYTEEDTKELYLKLESIKTKENPDKSLDRLTIMLILSLVFLALSFVPSRFFSSFLSFKRETISRDIPISQAKYFCSGSD